LAHMQEHYQRLKLPVGVLFGTGDRVLDHVKHGVAMAAKITGLDLELIEDGGHMILMTSADRAAGFIARMARRVAANTTAASTT
jgi:pimeloyl-ACP methyl ester carboxylesterase